MARAQIAAFDLDGTLLDGQSGSLIVTYLVRRGLLSKTTTVLCAWWGIRYKWHLPYRQDEVRERIFKDLDLLQAGQVDRIFKEFHQEVMVPRYRAQGLEALRAHARAGDVVALISATFDQVAQAAAEYLGADVALATVMERDADGHFTGRVDGKVAAGPEKVARIRSWADARFGRDGWELASAYGDHHTDVPMLEAARRPFAVNPERALRREAARRGWAVLDWR